MFNLAEVVQRLDAAIGDTDSDTPQARKRLRILEAATECFVSTGYRKTSVAEIAEHAGIAKGTVYLYFKTKADILFAAIALEKKQHLGSFMAIFDPALSDRQRLQHWIRDALVVTNKMPISAKLLAGDRELETALAEGPQDQISQSNADRDTIFPELIEKIVGRGVLSPEQLLERGRTLVSIMTLGPHLAAHSSIAKISLERVADIMSAMLVEGLAAPTETP